MAVIWYMRSEGENPSLHFYRLKGSSPSHTIHIGMVWEELAIDDAVSYTQRGNGLYVAQLNMVAVMGFQPSALTNWAIFSSPQCQAKSTSWSHYALPYLIALVCWLVCCWSFTSLQHLRWFQHSYQLVYSAHWWWGYSAVRPGKSGCWHNEWPDTPLNGHWANQSLPYHINAECQAREQQVSVW